MLFKNNGSSAQLKPSGSYCLFQLQPEFALWLKENYLELSFVKWEYHFLSRRRSNFLAWKVWVRCSLQLWLLLPSSFSCPHLMGRHHSAREDNVEREGRSDYEDLFCWYCCCSPTACCLRVLTFALWGHLNLAGKIPPLSQPPWNPAAVFLHHGLCCFICHVGIADSYFLACWKMSKTIVSLLPPCSEVVVWITIFPLL